MIKKKYKFPNRQRSGNDSFGLANVRFEIPDGMPRFEVTGTGIPGGVITEAALLKSREPKYTLWTRLAKPFKSV